MDNQTKSYENSDEYVLQICDAWEERNKASDPTAYFRERYPNDILGFFENELNIILNDEPGANQVEIALALQRAANGEGKRFIAVKSGAGTGKSRIIAAGATLWFLLSFKESQVITTSASEDQLKLQLWSAIRTMILRSGRTIADCFDQVNNLEIFIKGYPDWYAVGKSARRPENITGFHAPHVLVIFDECPAIDENILKTALSVMTTANCIGLKIGNPLKTEGVFYDSFHDDAEDNECFHLNPECSSFVTPSQLDALAKAWGGRNSPFYAIYGQGEFPKRSRDQLIAVDWVLNSKDRLLDKENKKFKHFKPNMRVLSLDVASMGDDFTVPIILDIDIINWLYSVKYCSTKHGLETPEITDLAVSKIEQFEPDYVIVDAIGEGWGVYTSLNKKHTEGKLGKVKRVISYKSSRKPPEMSLRYANMKSFSYDHMKDIFKDGRITIPKYFTRLLGELPAIRWKLHNGKIYIIDPKKSPDHADALDMGCVVPKIVGLDSSEEVDMGEFVEATSPFGSSGDSMDPFGGIF